MLPRAARDFQDQPGAGQQRAEGREQGVAVAQRGRRVEAGSIGHALIMARTPGARHGDANGGAGALPRSGGGR